MRWPWEDEEPATEARPPAAVNDVAMTPVDASAPYNDLQSPVNSHSIQIEYPKSGENVMYDHDLIMIFPYRQDGEKKNPHLYTVEAFVSLMMGKDYHRTLRFGRPHIDFFKRVFRTSRCYLDDKGNDLISIKEVDHNEEMTQKRYEAEECVLIAEYEAFIKSREPTTEQLYCKLIACSIARRIQLACGLTTRLFFSCDADEIIMTIRADDNDLRVEADRIDYLLQVSNKPFSTHYHPHKLEKVRHEMEIQAVRDKISGDIWQQSIDHLRERRGAPSDDPNVPEMDMLLLCEGEEYHPDLASALKRWGHTEEADGLFRENEKLNPWKEKSIWYRFYQSLTELSYDPRTYFSPFAEYRREALYQPYYRRYPIQWGNDREETLFTRKDRIRLTASIVHRHINTEVLVASKYLVGDMFPLHEEQGLKDLRESWATNIWMVHQPLHKIRDYFGEKVALYFAWLGFYTKMLVFPSLAGLITFIIVEIRNYEIKKKPHNENENQGYILIAFAVFVVIWSAFFSELWKRKNHLFNTVWGVAEFHRTLHYRANFRGTTSYNPVTDAKEMTFESSKKRHRAYLLSVIVVFIMVCIVLIALIGLFWLKYFINSDQSTVDKSYRSTVTLSVTVVNAIQIIILNMVYRGVAVKLTEWENHRTDREYENNLIIKVFLFQFCNSFASFFYIAFLKRSVEGSCLSSAFKKDDCMTELRNQLLILFLIRIVVGNTLEVVIPYLKYRFQVWKERHVQDVHNMIEKQTKLMPYGNEESFEDYNEMVIQFGFINLFVVAFPLTPLLALANNAMEVHVDSIKLCFVHRRPFPIAIKSIGAWFYILRVMSMIAIGTNSALILWTSDLFKNQLSRRDKWFAFVVALQIGLLITVIVEKTVSDLPKPLKQLMKRYDYIVDVVFKNMSVGDDSNLIEIPEQVNVDIYPNEEWDDRVIETKKMK